MKTKLKLIAICHLLSAICLSVFAQGSLTPPGAPAPTMKTLAQIEPRTPISSVPFTITASGSYYLTTNLTVSSGNAITIATSGVTLDLGGWTISSTAPAATGSGIYLNGGLRNIAIFNGLIQGGATNNGSGVYNGPGFQNGIYTPGSYLANARVAGVAVSGCSVNGIYLSSSDSTLAESCNVKTVGGTGIFACTIKNSVALDCGSSAIYGSQVSDCRAQCAGGDVGLYAVSAQNCFAQSGSGTGLHASTALNCYGASSSGPGLTAILSLNSDGFSGGYNTALSADVAENSYGYSVNGTGLSATYSALNCYGYSNGSGTGLSTSYSATGCYGYSYSGIGLLAHVATSCNGSANFSTGLSAYIANSCTGSSSGGTAILASYKYNMP